MMSLLLPELQNVGLEVNHTKTKLLTTDPSIFKINTSSILYIHDRYFQVLAPHEWHKYLGRYLTFSAHSRSSNELNHRIAAAWSQFHKRKYIFQNSNLSVKLKLEYFHAYVTPCALYGLGALSLGKTAMERLARVQQKMLRLIIGWQRYEGECWRTTMHRMKIKLSNALNTFYVESWDELVLKRKWSWANRILEMNDDRWAKQMAFYSPVQISQYEQSNINNRKRGRPRLKWEDDLNAFARYYGYMTWLDFGQTFKYEWEYMAKDFINFTLHHEMEYHF